MCSVFALAACSEESGGNGANAAAAGPVTPAATSAPAGAYTLDKSHASLIFRVDHLGFSMYTARFTRFDANMWFDPEKPETITVAASIDPRSLETDYPDPESLDFNAMLQGPGWLDAARFPQITFRSTEVALTGPDTARVTGDLGLHGVTRPVSLGVKFNGGYAGHPLDPNGRIGFSARGSLKRSDFGIAFGIPPAGTKMGVGDKVEVIIEAEFTGPPMKKP
jgi:polyisoprenoid-binding protein YceI